MRVGRIVHLLQLLLLLLLPLLGNSVCDGIVASSERGWRAQITSPRDIKGAVPGRSRRQPNFSRSQVGADNFKAPSHDEECIAMPNGRYVICPTFQSDSIFARAKPSASSDETTEVGYLLRKVRTQMPWLLLEIDDFLINEELKEGKKDFQKHLEKLRKQLRDPGDLSLTKYLRDMTFHGFRTKRHAPLHHHPSSVEWNYVPYVPEGYVIYEFDTPIVLQWPIISSEYIRQIYNLLYKNNRQRQNHREHIYDYDEEYREDAEEFEDYAVESEDEISVRINSFNGPPTKPTNAPLSHMLEHIYPPWPMNKTTKN